MALVSAAEVTAAVPKLATSPDLAALIDDVSAAIVNVIGFDPGLGAVAELHDGDDSGRLWLRKLPVVSVTSVTVNGVDLDNSAGDAWTVNYATGELVRGKGQEDARFAAWFPRGTRNVQVVYTGGTLTTPGPIRRACILTIKLMADAAKASGLYKSEETGSYKYTFQDPSQVTIPSQARWLLGPYFRDLII